MRLPTLALAVFFYFFTGMGITAGYHRLFSHKAYRAHWTVRLALALAGAGAFQGSAKWWCRNHRAHHRFTDTDKDPYNVRKGFWWAHLGWMLSQQDYSRSGFADITDIKNDRILAWQHKYYGPIGLFVSVILPTAIAALWGDVWGGYFYASMARIVFVHHATFFVNSLAHYWGDQPFSRISSSCDSFITALLTLGEGYHNYHHVFPTDYRNGIQWWHYDPTKWLISGLAKAGLVTGLRAVSDEEIERARAYVSTGQSLIPAVDSSLPTMTLDAFRDRVAQGDMLIVLEGQVYDVADFSKRHPGGYKVCVSRSPPNVVVRVILIWVVWPVVRFR